MASAAASRPGPQRPNGAPSGPADVRRATLDAAAELFGRHGVPNVSLREIAAAADVQVSLIARYVGSRAELVEAVFVDLSEQLGREVVDRPLEMISFEAESVMGRWTRVLLHLALVGNPIVLRQEFNPALGLAEVIEAAYGLDDEGARRRGAQIVASALGWRLFEQYLVRAAGLEGAPLEDLRADLTAMHRRLGATPWPSPPDPPVRPPGP